MFAISNIKQPNVNLSVTVRIKITEVNKAKTGASSSLSVVISKTEESFYKLSTKNGILKQLYAKSEFSISKERFLTKEVLAIEIYLSQKHQQDPLMLLGKVSENVTANLNVPQIGVLVKKPIAM
ncbi:uncharacterized protein NPIL_646431 [Nephila pilipes]|uniref:Uncharacterized protein n=1 Tax=Nephila pilipes TaxID=299642 RepID=A0A8X6UMJ2_NEPPI|nr:uncharacterized protein NPIL_646431 [Nephila pilipes]